VWMFDRGYPSYESILYLTQNYPGHFLFRSPATSTFPAVEAFIKSGKKQAVIWITASHTFKRKVSIKERREINNHAQRTWYWLSPLKGGGSLPP